MKLTKAFIASLSDGKYVKLDQDELDKVIQGVANGKPIIVRNGLINPSYLIGIMLDRDRMEEWRRECRHGDGDGERALDRGLTPLVNVFEGTMIGTKLEELAAAKQIGGR